MFTNDRGTSAPARLKDESCQCPWCPCPFAFAEGANPICVLWPSIPSLFKVPARFTNPQVLLFFAVALPIS